MHPLREEPGARDKKSNNGDDLPANEPLEFVAIDILGPLPKTFHGNRFLLVISDRFFNLTITIPRMKTTALAVAKEFCTHWVLLMASDVSSE
jgi:hypothetical protein